jgi:hypothetical protein
MARQFREQLEEEVQLEEARKARQSAAPAPVEPVPAAAPGGVSAPGADANASPAAAPHAERPVSSASHAGNGSDGVNPEHAHGSYSTPHAGADPSANQPTQAAGADERRT